MRGPSRGRRDRPRREQVHGEATLKRTLYLPPPELENVNVGIWPGAMISPIRRIPIGAGLFTADWADSLAF